MKKTRRTILGALIAMLVVSSIQAQSDSRAPSPEKSKPSLTGILLLAHGGKQKWNDEVLKIAGIVDRALPVEVAFGMATKRNIQEAINRLINRGIKEIVAVPLFVSSHSSVITSTEYLLGLRKQAPPQLATYAKMDHGHSAHQVEMATDGPFDPMTPIKTTVPIRMTSALNRHPLVADILVARAVSISRQPADEVVVIVAHGPVLDDENEKWLADMKSLAEIMRGNSGFRRIEYLTVRDDAPEPVRSRATTELRSVVERASGSGNRVLIVPLLLAYGGIEEGIRKRLEGLNYTMCDQGLLPDERLAQWVILSATSPKPAR
jgi:sirohydrochlorin ferrochelatase